MNEALEQLIDVMILDRDKDYLNVLVMAEYFAGKAGKTEMAKVLGEMAEKYRKGILT